jgi:uncharacterized protein YjlB
MPDIEHFFLPEDAEIPNNPVLPVVVMREVLARDTQDRAAAFEDAFHANGWQGIWRNGIFDYHHFHTRGHEALGIAKGHVRILLGGETGRTVKLNAGDLAVLPAGTGHKNVGASSDILVVGGYPPGQGMDIVRSIKDCPDAKERIAALKLPETDPVAGKNGSMLGLWR